MQSSVQGVRIPPIRKAGGIFLLVVLLTTSASSTLVLPTHSVSVLRGGMSSADINLLQDQEHVESRITDEHVEFFRYSTDEVSHCPHLLI